MLLYIVDVVNSHLFTSSYTIDHKFVFPLSDLLNLVKPLYKKCFMSHFHGLWLLAI